MKNKVLDFFCKIPFPDLNNMLSVFITNNHIINQELLNKDNIIIEINIEEENNIKKLNLNNRKKYTNEEYDITIIEIKNEDEIKNYLELDDIIINDILNNNNKNKNYIDETIYIIQYPKSKLSVSYRILNQIYEDKKYNFNHKCSTEGGSSGSPILNINNILIGIHKEGIYNKYNKGTFLNYPMKECVRLYNNNNYYLQEFNRKYNFNIEDTITNLELSECEIGDEGLKDLCKIELKELKVLLLEGNNISDIKVFEKVKFEKLEILILDINNISDINALKKVNFKELKALDLFDNKISDIKVLKKVKFEKLESLNLEKNKISNINVLKKVNFKELKEIHLSGNNISDINVLEKVNFKDLKELYLDGNNISDIKVLEKVKFEKLETLSLKKNKISIPDKNSIKQKLKIYVIL